MKKKNSIVKIATALLPTEYGEFDISVYMSADGREHAVLSAGNFSKAPTLTRVHSECLTGETFASLRCDCGPQLRRSMEMVQKKGGVIIYLNQEGRGIGLGNKIKAYALQQKGYDTVDANHELGFPTDARDYEVAALILKDLGVKKIALLTNNPDKENQLISYGIKIEKTLPLEIPPNKVDAHYLATKKKRMGHRLKM